MNVNYTELEKVIYATEHLQTNKFTFHIVFECISSCGTVGCLIGNYNCMVDREKRIFGGTDYKTFGITAYEYSYLFSPSVFFTDENILTRSHKSILQEGAVARVKKFIAYKQAKEDMVIVERIFNQNIPNVELIAL